MLNKRGSLGVVLVMTMGSFLMFAASAFAQLPAPAVPTAPGAPAPTAEVERVVVTGSNPVDTYRAQDIEKLGIRNATDLTTFIPQEAGGTVQLNLRGLLLKETLVLIDGKRVAQSALNGVFQQRILGDC